MVYIGHSMISGFRHPLGVLEHTPRRSGQMTVCALISTRRIKGWEYSLEDMEYEELKINNLQIVLRN